MELLFERFLSEERGEWPESISTCRAGNVAKRVIPARLRTLRSGPAAAMTANVDHLPRTAARCARLARRSHPQGRDRPARAADATVSSTWISTNHPRCPSWSGQESTGRSGACASLRDSSDEIQDLPSASRPAFGGMVIARGGSTRWFPLRAGEHRRAASSSSGDKEDWRRPRDHQGRSAWSGGMMSGAPKTRWRCWHETGVEIGPRSSASGRSEGLRHAAAADTSVSSRSRAARRWPTLPRMKPERLLRPGGRGGHHPAWADRREDGEIPISSAATAETPIGVPAPVARADTRAHAGRPLFQEQAAADGDGRGRFTGGEAGGAAPGDWASSAPGAHEGDRVAAAREGCGSAGSWARRRTRSSARSAPSRSTGFPGVARRELRPDRVTRART